VRSNPPRVATVTLATTALLLVFSPPVASADSHQNKDEATGAYAHGPLPPPAPVKDYSKNAATGDYSGWRGMRQSTEPVSASPAEFVTAADPGPGDFFDWGDAALGASVGFVLALLAGGATVALVRWRIASPATARPADLTRAEVKERRHP
jgi:hypothetical protein